ncbi:hypothetical protein F5B19DRAFT_466987 [Rostrohypoxylon terebratum]|nr:hypothetical protein F5B19DRAFT_466987 [Rostrohypoxylon terebratum]
MSASVMIHFQPDKQLQLMRACDRCHQSKSKCLRDSDDEPCQRCFRANADCVSSRPASRRQAQNTFTNPGNWTGGKFQAHNPIPLEAITTSFNSSTKSLDQESNETGVNSQGNGTEDKTSGDPLESSGGLSSPPIQTPPPYADSHMDIDVDPQRPGNSKYSSKPVTKPRLAASGTFGPHQLSFTEESLSLVQKPLVDLLQELSSLNIDLTRYLSAIPDINLESIGGDLVSSEGTNLFSIDQIFHLSQVFIDIISQICSGLPPSHTDTPEQTTEAKSAHFSLDPASELLIFSTYLRLIEIHDRILRLMKAAVENKEPNSPIRYPFQVPDFTFGSFSLPSKTDTRSILLIHVMDTMTTRAQEIVAEATAPKQTSGYRGDFQSFGGVSLVIVPDLAKSAIRIRENALVDMIEDLKKSIL